MKTIVKTAAFAAVLAAASVAVAQEKVTISIATGPTSGVYYPLGGGIANILSKYVPGYAANAESTAGSVANIQLMSQKKSDLALSMADAAWDGYPGQGKFQSGTVPLRALMVAYPNRMHVVSIEGTGINKFADLKGKRVSTGAPNSATELMAFRVLDALGSIPRRTSSASASTRASRPTRSRTGNSTPTSGSAASRPPPSPISARPRA